MAETKSAASVTPAHVRVMSMSWTERPAQSLETMRTVALVRKSARRLAPTTEKRKSAAWEEPSAEPAGMVAAVVFHSSQSGWPSGKETVTVAGTEPGAEAALRRERTSERVEPRPARSKWKDVASGVA